MAKGDEWRYDDIGPRRDTSNISKHQISREAPEWMTRVSSCVTATDHGSAHPFSFDGIKQKTGQFHVTTRPIMGWHPPLKDKIYTMRR